MNKDYSKNSLLIKREAQRLGFNFCGISRAEFLESEASKLEKWLNNGMHGKMSYMENYFDKRLDPQKLVPGAKSVVSLIYNYSPREDFGTRGGTSLKIAKYAYGEDYHHVIKNKLKELINILTNELGEINGRVFVDSAPVMERIWAEKSGVGWIGKNSLLLNKSMGSYFFIAELILDIEFEYDGPVKDYCGTCTRCMDACPTDAIPSPYVVNASKCISYLTIELKDEIPDEFSDKMENWIFGCDICQDVCPWNRFAQPHDEPAFDPVLDYGNMELKEWKEMTKDIFNKTFKRSPIKRTRFKGLKRNIDFILKKNPDKVGI